VLHDIGKLVIAVELPEHIQKAMALMRDSGCSMHAAEKETWGFTHAEVGGYRLGLWGLPYPIVETVANHHEPMRVDNNEFGILGAAHVANCLVHQELSARSNQPIPGFDQAYLERTASSHQLESWRELARKRISG